MSKNDATRIPPPPPSGVPKARPNSGRSPAGVISGRYRIGKRRWPHPMGEVFEAMDLPRSTRVTLTILRPASECDDAALGSVLALTRPLTAVGRPELILPLNLERLPPGRIGLITDTRDAQPLSREVVGRALPTGRAVGILRQLVHLLQQIHQAGVHHSALTVGSVLLESHGALADHVLLTDLGLSHLMRFQLEVSQASASLQAISPERALGSEPDAREDQYLVGCLAYTMLTGGPPFRTGNVDEVARRHAIEDPMPIGQRLRGHAPPEPLLEVVHRCLSKDPEERFADMRSLAAALQDAQDEAGITTPWDDLATSRGRSSASGGAQPRKATAEPMRIDSAASIPIELDVPPVSLDPPAPSAPRSSGLADRWAARVKRGMVTPDAREAPPVLPEAFPVHASAPDESTPIDVETLSDVQVGPPPPPRALPRAKGAISIPGTPGAQRPPSAPIARSMSSGAVGASSAGPLPAPPRTSGVPSVLPGSSTGRLPPLGLPTARATRPGGPAASAASPSTEPAPSPPAVPPTARSSHSFPVRPLPAPSVPPSTRPSSPKAGAAVAPSTPGSPAPVAQRPVPPLPGERTASAVSAVRTAAPTSAERTSNSIPAAEPRAPGRTAEVMTFSPHAGHDPSDGVPVDDGPGESPSARLADVPVTPFDPSEPHVAQASGPLAQASPEEEEHAVLSGIAGILEPDPDEPDRESEEHARTSVVSSAPPLPADAMEDFDDDLELEPRRARTWAYAAAAAVLLLGGAAVVAFGSREPSPAAIAAASIEDSGAPPVAPPVEPATPSPPASEVHTVTPSEPAPPVAPPDVTPAASPSGSAGSVTSATTPPQERRPRGTRAEPRQARAGGAEDPNPDPDAEDEPEAADAEAEDEPDDAEDVEDPVDEAPPPSRKSPPAAREPDLSGLSASELAERGNALFNAGKFAEASRVLEQAVRRDGRNGNLRILLGDAYYKQGKRSAAREHYARAQELGHSAAERRLNKVDSEG